MRRIDPNPRLRNYGAQRRHAATAAVAENPSLPFNVVEATIPEMRDAMERKHITSRELVLQFLSRIGLYEDKLHCIITVNPGVLQEAAERDRRPSRGEP